MFFHPRELINHVRSIKVPARIIVYSKINPRKVYIFHIFMDKKRIIHVFVPKKLWSSNTKDTLLDSNDMA